MTELWSSYPWQILISFSTICTLVSFYDCISTSPTSDDRFVRDSLRAIDLDVTAHGVASVWDLRSDESLLKDRKFASFPKG